MILLRKIKELQKLLAEIQDILAGAVVEKDDFVIHLRHARKDYRKAIYNSTKSGKRIEYAAHSSFLEAMQKFGFQGSRDQWEHLLRLEKLPERDGGGR